MNPLRVTVWNEFLHEKVDDAVRTIYPDGIHGAIAHALRGQGGFEVATATQDEPECGLDARRLAATDVLVWWGHMRHEELPDAVVDRLHQEVLAGMGLVILHSAVASRIFRRLMGTNCTLRWRDVGEKERVWTVAPDHPIAEGIGEYFEIPRSETYGERFDVPEPDRLVFISWHAGGEVFRSGCAYHRGNGRIFFFAPGHESYPIYHQEPVARVLANACRWAAPRVRRATKDFVHAEEAPEQARG